MKRQRIHALILALCMLVGLMPVPAIAAPDPYWALQAAYNAAVETPDPEDDIPACEGIIEYYKALDSETACYRVISPLLRLVKLYEERGRFADAHRLYKMYQQLYTYLDEHTDKDCSESLRYAEAFLAQYAFTEPTVYTTAKSPADVPYFGAPGEPKVGTYAGMCGVYDPAVTNAYLLYVQFTTETIRSFSYRLPKNAPHYLLEIAWNTSDHTIEYFESIANGSQDEYIKADLDFLATLEGCDILIRFGAEVNEWEANTTYAANGRLEEFKAAYIAAFRHLSDMVHTAVPGVAMVYSPNDISNMNVTPMDFYPGDAYVDWVGLSSYQNLSKDAIWTYGSMNDAYYCRGVYENQIIKLGKIVSLFGDRKPILISESGFMYKSDKSEQTMAHATERMRLFYAYVNMVFPQIKAIFHFNTNYGGEYYKLFDGAIEAPVNTLADEYLTGLSTNVPIASLLKGDAEGYTRLTTLHEKRDQLNLAVFASYPGNPTVTVTYTWDGKTVGKTDVAPYAGTVEKEYLTEGRHTLCVTTVCKASTYEQVYVVYVRSDGTVWVTEGDLTDVPENNWAYPYVSYCVGEGFFDGMTEQAFLPTKSVTRADFVMLLGRAAGIDPASFGAPDFRDVPKGAVYAPYVAWAKEAGVTAGVSETEFAPDVVITREQICAMLVRYCVNVGLLSGDPPVDYEAFADNDDIASYFVDAVYTARREGIVNGKDGNRFDPKAKLTRQEIAVILKNFHTGFIRK